MSESTTSHTHFHSMTDSQLHQAINQLSAAGKVQQTPGQVAHPGKSTSVFLVLQELNKIILIAYFNNIRQWSTSVTPPPTNGRTNPTRTRSRLARGSSLAPAPPQPTASTSTQQPIPPPAQSAPTPVPPLIPEYPTAHRRVHIPPTTQAYHSTYASRLRTGTTLLMQPILTSSSTAAVNTRSTRRGGVVNYADPGSGDEFPDAGALDSDDSDFIASGGTRSAMRAARLSSKAPIGAGVFHAGGTMTPTTPLRPPTPQHQKTELEQSYLGMIPPSRFIVAKPVGITRQEY